MRLYPRVSRKRGGGGEKKVHLSTTLQFDDLKSFRGSV